MKMTSELVYFLVLHYKSRKSFLWIRVKIYRLDSPKSEEANIFAILWGFDSVIILLLNDFIELNIPCSLTRREVIAFSIAAIFEFLFA